VTCERDKVEKAKQAYDEKEERSDNATESRPSDGKAIPASSSADLTDRRQRKSLIITDKCWVLNEVSKGIYWLLISPALKMPTENAATLICKHKLCAPLRCRWLAVCLLSVTYFKLYNMTWDICVANVRLCIDVLVNKPTVVDYCSPAPGRGHDERPLY
jgi:hypothetical protein